MKATHHEFHRNKVLSTPDHASVLHWLMHPLVPLMPQWGLHTRQRTRQLSFEFSALLLLLRILEASFSPPDDQPVLDAMAFITSWVLHLHHSNKLFSPRRSSRLPRTAVVVFLHIYFPAKLFRHSFLLFCRFPIQDFDASTPLLCPWTSCHFGSTAAPLVAGGRILLAACQPQPQEGQTVEEAKVHQ